MTSTYSISLTYFGGTFNGRFTVDNSSNLILNFYDNTNPSVNILVGNCGITVFTNTYTPTPYVFSATIDNTFTDNKLIYPILNLFNDGFTLIDTLCEAQLNAPATILITPYNPNRFSLKQICCSIYSDNARVFYKPHSLPSCGVGTVKNSRHVAKKT